MNVMTPLLLAFSLSMAVVPVITLERTACYGSCPVYKITIYDDGKVLYEGTEYVKQKGKAEGRIEKSELDALLHEFEKINYLSLDENYTDDPKNCPQQWTDNPSAITSLNWKGKSKTIRHYYGCRGSSVAEQLTALETRIDAVAKTERWIK